MNEHTRRRHIVAGQVQGVGFRPFVYRLATEAGLSGFVKNTPEGVVIEVEGEASAVTVFGRRLLADTPPLARILNHLEEAIPLTGNGGFHIEKSAAGAGHEVLISPDTATCPDCLADISDPGNRRFRYPFTNCTNCGPRYTITRSIPYDRETTSMACFPMCPACLAEYENPLDRRFHAQPNACPVCGPHVWLVDREGKTLAEADAALRTLAEALAAGRIAAVKGLGGFHLACDAGSDAAVAELRRRKNRPSKPLAVMVPDLGAARRIGAIGKEAEALLTGNIRPIVLLPAMLGAVSRLIHPDTAEVGVMLPYTPLHHVLLSHLREALPPGRVPALVMTSGNAGGEPIALGNREAFSRLADIADLYLFHNRDILIRTDDSVTRTLEEPESQAAPAVMFLRRARGYTPSPVRLAGAGPAVVGLGPELKATVCVTKGDQAFLSQHIGDLENLATFGFHQEILAHLTAILKVTPEACVADLHPDYLSTGFALEQTEWPVLRLQHHFAHIHAVLAEHRINGPALGLALDGTGLGEDGTVWGGECLFIDPGTLESERLAHFSPVLLPGGEAAVREPWRMAQAYFHALGLTKPQGKPWPWLAKRSSAAVVLAQMLEKKVNCPVTTSCGRLFDAVAGLLGLCAVIDYEGQAAIVLENVQDRAETGAYACPVDLTRAPARLDTLSLFAQAAADFERGADAAKISRRFHLGLARGLADLCRVLAEAQGTRLVGLSGGVMQNRTLATLLPALLEKVGLTPLSHRSVPPSDACIALGQAAYGVRRLAG